jgi:hypothetical protein
MCFRQLECMLFLHCVAVVSSRSDVGNKKWWERTEISDHHTIKC